MSRFLYAFLFLFTLFQKTPFYLLYYNLRYLKQSKMRILIPFIVLICISNIYCRGITSNSIVDQLYAQAEGKEAQPKIKLTWVLRGAFNKLLKSIKPPKGYESPNICVWKSCSKPLKNVKGQSPKNKMTDQERNEILKKNYFHWKILEKKSTGKNIY